MGTASVIAVVGTALTVTKDAVDLCLKYRDLDRTIVALHRKADRLRDTLDLVSLALETRRNQLEARCGQTKFQPFELRERQIWEKLEQVTWNCKETTETFKRETRRLRHSESFRSSLVQFWKSSYRESAFGRYEREIDGYFSIIQVDLACLSP